MGQSVSFCNPQSKYRALDANCDPCVRHLQGEELKVSPQLNVPKAEGIWFDDALLAGACASNASENLFLHRRRLLLAGRRLFSPHQQHRFGDFYMMGRKLGDGASADVYEATARPINRATGLPEDGNVMIGTDQRRFAVKVFSLNNTTSGKPQHEVARNCKDFFKAEWEMLAQLEHPHIVRMYECFQDINCLYIVLEMCYGGELIEFVREVSRRRGRGGLQEQDARHIFRQMLYAGSYMHCNCIVHRDIKLENFLLVGRQDSADAVVIKLCDFGTAVTLTEQMPRAFGRIGTLSYTSPEVCADKGATVLADCWSLGVVLYVLIVGAKPFRSKVEESREETMQRIAVGNFNESRPTWKMASQDAQDLVKTLIVVEEGKRLASGRALLSKWCQVDAPSAAQCGDWVEIADSLKLFSHVTRLDPLQQFVLSLCAKLLAEASMVHMEELGVWFNFFYVLDANKDGYVDFAELARGLWELRGQSSNLTSTQLSAVAHALDLNSSGAIEWAEWAAVLLLSIGGYPPQDELLATALRLLTPRDVDHSASHPESPPISQVAEVRGASIFLPPRDKPPLSPARIQQLRERFAAWVPPEGLEAASGGIPSTTTASHELCLADLRDVLESSAWFGLNAASGPLVTGRPLSLAPPIAPEQSAASSLSSPRDTTQLAASPLQTPRDTRGEGASTSNAPNAPNGITTSLLASTLSRSSPLSPRFKPTAEAQYVQDGSGSASNTTPRTLFAA